MVCQSVSTCKFCNTFFVYDLNKIYVVGYSESPESSKDMARNALRSVLRKSGSESPTSNVENFNFYDSLNSDPLGNFNINNNADVFHESNDKIEKRLSKAEDSVIKDKKPTIVRSQSEVHIRSSKTSEVMEKIFQEGEEFDLNSSNKPIPRPEDIFSDSESSSPARKLNNGERAKAKSVKGHKRSRSDLGNIKLEKDKDLSNGAGNRAGRMVDRQISDGGKFFKTLGCTVKK